jgi:CelD/BcsL family acetyltransferase involved in cellulose biosynthesis
MAPAAAARIETAPRASLPAVRCEIVDSAWLEGRAEAWDRLIADAATPNPFFARRLVQAHLAHGLASPDLRFVAVHRGDALLALLPFDPHGTRVGLWRRAAAGWISPYVVTSTPLIARHGLRDHADALLDGMRAAGRLWLLPLLSLDSAAGAALQAALAARGWPTRTLSPFGRAVLDGCDEGAYESHLGSRRRKDLGRRRRRLAELGRLEVTSVCDGEGLRRAVEAFLRLEASGWKGAGGTALACRPETAAYLRAAFTDAGGPVCPRADMLCLDGRPVAISLAFVCGGTAYMFKTAYDESLRRHAPGVLLEDEIVRLRRETGFAERLNSATLPGSVMEHLYPHREAIGDLLIATDAGVPASEFDALTRQDALRRRSVERLKRLYRRVRSACQPTAARGLASVDAK